MKIGIHTKNKDLSFSAETGTMTGHRVEIK